MDSIVHLKLFMYGILNNSVCLFGLSGNFLLLYIFFLYKGKTALGGVRGRENKIKLIILKSANFAFKIFCI